MSKRQAGQFLASAVNVSDEVAKYLAAARAPGTVRAYRTAYAAFCSWCEVNAKDHTKPDPVTIAEYLAYVANTRTYSTAKLHLGAIVHCCRQSGYDVNFKDVLIRDTLQGIERVNKRREVRSAALMLDDIRMLLGTCENRAKGIRDRALLLVGFAGAFRRTELVSIDVRHLAWTDDTVCITIERSKEDQEARGENVVLVNGKDPTTCPITALKAWLAFAKITEGPVFRSITKGGKIKPTRLIDKQVARTVAERCKLAGIVAPDGRILSSHGLRAGFITEAYRAGLSDEEIMGHTRHRDIRRMRIYVRRERLSRTSPAGRIGL